jgi:hypothetical protein
MPFLFLFLSSFSFSCQNFVVGESLCIFDHVQSWLLPVAANNFSGLQKELWIPGRQQREAIIRLVLDKVIFYIYWTCSVHLQLIYKLMASSLLFWLNLKTGFEHTEGSDSRTSDKDYYSLTVERLRALLKERGLSPKGKKASIQLIRI